MPSIKLQAPCRLETETRVWDSAASKWIIRKLDKPRLIQNPPQQFTPEEAENIERYAHVLGVYIKTLKEVREGSQEREKAGPLHFIYEMFSVLEAYGFADISETAPVKHLHGYLWDLVDRYESREISWDAFEDQVERWQLVMVDKLDRAKVLA